MHRSYFKFGMIFILVIDAVLYFSFPTITPVLLVLLPICFIMNHLLSRFLYKRKLTNCDLDDIDRLSGFDFEYYLYFFFRKKHIRTRVTSYTHDFGADLILKYRGKKIVIQAKRWNDNVGIKAVQETIGALSYYKAQYGVVITNSFYTKSAIELADASNIVLLNRYDLVRINDLDKNELLNKMMNKSTGQKRFFVSKEELCPYCNSKLIKRSSRYGEFYGCSNYPSCTYTKDISE